MAEEQPEDLSAGISAGTGDRDRRHVPILHGYAQCRKSIYELDVCVGKRLETVFDVRPFGHGRAADNPRMGDTHLLI